MPGMQPDSTATAAETWVRSWTAAASERAAAAQSLSDQVSKLTVAASNRQRTVTVTVNGSGSMVDLQLSVGAEAASMDELARTILRTMRSAQASLGGQVAAIAARTVGPDSDTARAVIAGFEKRFPAEPGPEGEAGHGAGRRPHVR